MKIPLGWLKAPAKKVAMWLLAQLIEEIVEKVLSKDQQEDVKVKIAKAEKARDDR